MAAILLVGAILPASAGAQATRAPSAVPSLQQVRLKVRRATETTSSRFLNTQQHTCWQILHGVLAYGPELRIRRGAPDGELVPALEYLYSGGSLAGEEPFRRSGSELLGARGAGLQGHTDQFLAILAQQQVPAETELTVDGASFRVADLVQAAQAHAGEDPEASWTLIALAGYALGETWTNSRGAQQSIEDLVEHELAAPIESAACGGTHRLIALAIALDCRRRSGLPIEGAWQQAAQHLQRHWQRAREWQNPDGTFSSQYFRRPGGSSDVSRQLATTGHTLEFVVNAVPDEQLAQPWTLRAADKLADILLATASQPVRCGPLYHGARALVVFQQRTAPLDQTAE